MVIKRSSNATVTSSIITEFKPSPEFEYPASSYQQHQQGIINDEDDFDNIFSPNLPPSTVTPPLIPLPKKRKSLPNSSATLLDIVPRVSTSAAATKSSSAKKMQPQPTAAIATPAPSPALFNASMLKASVTSRGKGGIVEEIDIAVPPKRTSIPQRAGLEKEKEKEKPKQKKEMKRSPVHQEDEDRAKEISTRRDEIADRRNGARNRLVASTSSPKVVGGTISPFKRLQQDLREEAKDRQDVAHFLSSLPLPLSRLLPAFVSLGCTSASDLHALTLNTAVGIRCRGAVLEAVSRGSEGGLSAWERIVLDAGLEMLSLEVADEEEEERG